MSSSSESNFAIFFPLKISPEEELNQGTFVKKIKSQTLGYPLFVLIIFQLNLIEHIIYAKNIPRCLIDNWS
ncbi:hypothetical protein BpHYR1_017747 [Brachionus plicatilis]|uniref:Uncharacterized protein n=1 Tax=Brachionus plicatilis TaxID=10195 RepID=A0A3M7S6F0_BRAPC|nr:hypothetical protein BpHYR1_017747 [Brachionus plicatilis]